MRKLDAAAKSAVQKVIDKSRDQLAAIPGFVTAEPGFPLVDGRFLREPAVIVLVALKKAPEQLLESERAPRQLGPYRVCVMQADPMRQLENAADFADTMSVLATSSQALTYELRESNPIDEEFEVEKAFVCHVGPDAGWPVLQSFLEATKKNLSVAMYDFNADYIAKTFIDMIRVNDVKAALSWDNGLNADEQAIRKKLKPLQARGLTAALVRCGNGRRFANSYHEKVAVRDHKSFWLSSGNWSTRSQPNIDPVGDPKQAKGMYSKGNREWHVICEDGPLSKVFEDYILYDLDGSKQEEEEGDTGIALGIEPSTTLPDIFVPLDALLDQAVEMATPAVPIAPQRLPSTRRKVRVRPVLTPDNYLQRVNELIDSAVSSLYMQFAYINWSEEEGDAEFTKLLLKLADMSTRQDLDMRIIMGSGNAAAKIRLLVQAGFNQDVFRTQGNIHNKGIIVDGRAVLVSSTNWSSDGVLRNRDAGLIIHDEEVAAYYEAVFLNDWEMRARASIQDDAPAVIASAGSPTPPGMVRMSWNDYFA